MADSHPKKSHTKLAPLQGNHIIYRQRLYYSFSFTFDFIFLCIDQSLDASSKPVFSRSLQIQHKRDLVEAVRRTNPASVNTAPLMFWDVEGNLRTVSTF